MFHLNTDIIPKNQVYFCYYLHWQGVLIYGEQIMIEKITELSKRLIEDGFNFLIKCLMFILIFNGKKVHLAIDNL
jgi:hypothetical protein